MTRKIFGLAVVLIATAFPSAAMAEFESTTGKSQGSIATFPEKTTFETVEGGPVIECKSKNAEGKVIAEGGWQIQIKSTTQQGKFLYQAAALKGPHEQLKIIKFGVCVGPTGLSVEPPVTSKSKATALIQSRRQAPTHQAVSKKSVRRKIPAPSLRDPMRTRRYKAPN